MVPIVFGSVGSEPLSILCLGAHSDDIEIGCGGTILRLLAERPGSMVRWVVFSADDQREAEARSSASDFLDRAARTEVAVHRFKESYFPQEWAQIKEAFEALAASGAPDIVFGHCRHDEHQDHRILGELAWNTFRDHVILEYEIPKYEGDLGRPNLYVPLESAVARHKVDLLEHHFGSQRNRRWFRRATFDGLMAVRAVECAAESGAAEAFHARKLVLPFPVG